MRQLIIARKDLQMSPGKLAAQVSHASMAFLSYTIRNSAVPKASVETGETERYETLLSIPAAVYEQWFCGIYTKTICEAKNRNHLLKAAAMAEELGLKENVDFFLIRDNCLTELEPEEIDEEGIGHTLTCIGFRPLPDETAHAISRKYQLYK
ncbi:MAG: peptidyl-tRNA hydrolase [Parasporobacterium sp.]|nr:peptidyl-tRNA hydrolase [Parasporobacterium sp.]